ncbi:uncharacterized protein LY89DRAFT_741665 [Mollisia scopiformis]|uniref:Uncharacterized protein n=1 Tax=Mollisia scopiformis TaxID=149040 RepID=A0A132B8U6_MOLSC|nr:uncharacterized protein LY89DRAFT_741665 [Mollisia scopiformis]KUJ08828.1 hypothetical protein LY89DRAFT_741665 [Mollisia scopiformis]
MPAIIQDVLSLVAPSSVYTVLQRFTMPTAAGPKAVIALTFESSKILQSLYTLMLKMIVIQIWYLIVLIGISLSASPKKQRSHNISIANVIIWNAQAAPLDIVKLMFGYIAHISLYALTWTVLAAFAWAASIALSLLVSPDLIIGMAAPVAADAIYVPEYSPYKNTSSYSLRVEQISTPANLRAIGLADNLTTSANVSVGTPTTSVDGYGETIYQLDYSYQLSDVDFGLQHASGLLLAVNGSCITDYTWFAAKVDNPFIVTDVYVLFGNDSNTGNASTADGGPPLATFYLDPAGPQAPIGSNISYAIIISSLGRKSFTPSSDPWYQTAQLPDDPAGAGYIVSRGKPVLSCWQTDIWSYGNESRSINDLEQLGVLPHSLVLIFQHFLSVPRIFNLAQSLGTTALKSATGSQGYYFDAQTSNIHDDLQRLVLGAYEATKNTLQETTKFSRQYTDISNLVLDDNGNVLPGTDEFVIYTGEAAALSIPMLIAVPIIAVLLLALNFLLTTSLPCYALPWGYVDALRAAVIYSALDNDPNNDLWDRSTPAPIYKVDPSKKGIVHEAHVRPGYNPDKRTLSWLGSGHGTPAMSPVFEKKAGDASIVPPAASPSSQKQD